MTSARSSRLLDAEERHRADPDTFSIPRSDVRRGLARGARVKLLFGSGEPGRPMSSERMWVEVVGTADGGDDDERYVGRLANTPVVIEDLSLGDLIAFGPRHVAAIWRRMPFEPSPGQFAIVSSRVWRAGARPVRASRIAAPDPAFSGWILFASDDAARPPDDLSGFEPVTHHDLVIRLRSFDSIEDEAPGTEWQWDGSTLEWRALVGSES
jgi:hypothetical protein